MTTDEVICRNLDGGRRRVRLTGTAGFASPGSVLRQRLVTTAGDVPLLCKSVPIEAGRRDHRLYDMLDNEIRVLAHLTRVYGGRVGELPVLTGYNVDVEEPFVLLRPYAGQPATEAMRVLDQERKRLFQIGMLRALHAIAEAGVVHGALSLEAMRWNGSVVQLTDFESAQPAGEPRRSGIGPRQSPERVRGTGPADPRDDVWSAAVLIRELVLGPQAVAAPADLSGDPERLRQRLGDVFQPVDRRPTAADLLTRMRATVPSLTRADPGAGLADGYRMFEEACRRKGGVPPGHPPEGAPARRRGWRQLLTGRVDAR
ncbi:hypothetical protein [Actinoplanes sp. NPDC049265]|uniref:hypothetical protein n=1 Tax=Actinoplanes sp. NPDC049265 TaxID=3363902 RepID=UPI00371F7C34